MEFVCEFGKNDVDSCRQNIEQVVKKFLSYPPPRGVRKIRRSSVFSAT